MKRFFTSLLDRSYWFYMLSVIFLLYLFDILTQAMVTLIVIHSDEATEVLES